MPGRCVNSTSEVLSTVLSLFSSDTQIESDEELQDRMNSIVSHIMKSSNNAIVPRFNLEKRDDTGNITASTSFSDTFSSSSSSTILDPSSQTTYSFSSSSSSFSSSSYSSWSTSSTFSFDSYSTSQATDDYLTSSNEYSAPPSTTWSSTDYSPSTTSSTQASTSSTFSTTKTSASVTKTTPSSTNSPTPSTFSTSSGSYVVLGYTTVINNSTITSMHTITASATSSPKSSGGLSKKNKHIVIGCVVGIGIPFIVVAAAALFWYRRRMQDPTGRNYVDSNGRDIGISVDDGTLLNKLKFWKKNKSVGDFDNDSLDEDFSIDPSNTSNNQAGTNSNSGSSDSAGRSFVVDRPKPLRNATEQNF
ncbi:hypothetical protein FOA43_004105 [Brettanomyces nanus]|uniref:Mid2 domain-containing protein n=1 Tax=Eeniella nana TaxID=13502 RepID=A0A875S500_EENNA|nr:uncharacterized protein FOA43_004105 [Brettanomyces nanus]QPG76711.1 hypothetical protein FOA43_004105 [Brettanomyces nanus]